MSPFRSTSRPGKASTTSGAWSRGRTFLFFANAGSALGEAFHDQDWTDIRRLIDLNVTQTTAMLHRMARKMRDRGEGRILITGSIGGFVPGPFDAVYNASKAYLNSLSEALRDELRETGVTITCLMPGPTESRIFEAPIYDAEKDDTAMVARAGYETMMRGDAGVVPGFTNKVLTMVSGVVPSAGSPRYTASAPNRAPEPSWAAAVGGVLQGRKKGAVGRF